MEAIDPFELRTFRPFDPLTSDELSELAKHLRRARFVPGALICNQGEEGDRCFFLMSGQVVVRKDFQDGRFLPVATLPEGNIFSQTGLYGLSHPAQISAQTDVAVLTLDRSTFAWACERRVPWAVSLQVLVSQSLVRQMRAALGRWQMLAEADEVDKELQIQGEAIETKKEAAVYLNLSGSFSSLPAASAGGPASSKKGPEEPEEPEEVSEEDQLRNMIASGELQFSQNMSRLNPVDEKKKP